MKVHIIIDADGDIYCAAESYDKASEIMSADIESGDLMEGAFITNTRMWMNGEPIELIVPVI